MKPLDPALRRTLRARAHHLGVVVSVGHHGLTPQVLHEIDLALLAHELVKVRVFNDDRDARESMLERICSELDCAPVQHLGKLLILWRENPDAAAKARDRARPPKRDDDRRSQGRRRPAGGAGKGASKRTPADRRARVHDGFGRGEPDAIHPRRRRRRDASAMSSPLPGPRGPRRRSRTDGSPPSPPAPYTRERRDTGNPRRRRSAAPEQVPGATPRKRRRRGA